MKKTFKKIISLVLVLVMLMTVCAIAVAAGDVTTEAPAEHGSFISIFARFALEVFNFFKYIFHDLWLGKPPM